MSTIVAQSAAIEPVRPRPSDVCLSSGSNSSTPLTLRHKPETVELSHFNGLNPEAWLFQAERYFEFYNILPDHQLSLASFYLDGEVPDWYRWMFRNKQLIDWPHFAGKIRIRFRDQSLRSPEGRLSKLLQITTVADFRARFEAIANESVSLPEVMLVECFISGLKMDIQTEVAIRGPTTLEKAIRLAYLYEQKIDMARGPIRPAFARTQPLLPNPTGPTSIVVSKPIASSSHLPKIPFKRLSTTELQSRREKGLCYNCDEKYTPNLNAKHFPSYSLKIPPSQQLSYLSHSHRRISLLKNFSS
ncbi:uncharacterized protein [Nicotiana tomentosiformis]|uniref:uncharacterized protein n=1 Tax=Nicotiana tomentosiformis TaxID=4098 RepID=UPI00388C8F57